MIRPSSLALAEICPASAALSAAHPEGNANTEEGSAVDAEISAALTGGPEPTRKEARMAVEWLRQKYPGATFMVQQRVSFVDPETGEVITEGTPDVSALLPSKLLVIVDWKKKGQMFQGYVTEPGRNPQLLAYLVAKGLELGATAGQVVLAFFDDKGITEDESPIIPEVEWWPIIERIRAIQRRDPTQIVKGAHCRACYPRRHCPAWLLPAMKGRSFFRPFTKADGITEENEADLLLGLMAMEDALEVAWGRMEARAKEKAEVGIVVGDRRWGPIETKGRGGIDTERLKADGLYQQYYKPGKPGERFDFIKVKQAR